MPRRDNRKYVDEPLISLKKKNNQIKEDKQKDTVEFKPKVYYAIL